MFMVNRLFDTASHPGMAPVVKYYSSERNEISSNIKDSFVGKNHFIVDINIMKFFFPVKIGNCALNTDGIR